MRPVGILLWLVAAIGIASTAFRVREALPSDHEVASLQLGELSPPWTRDPEILGAAADRAAASSLFGQRGEPTPRPNDVDGTGVEPDLDIEVVGILGPPWTAVLRGFPDQGAARVVRAGDAVGPVTVTSISDDRLVLSWGDSILTLSPPWARR